MPSGISVPGEVFAMAAFKCSEFRPGIGGTDARIIALEIALVALTRELGYVLTHLDGANFTPEERERVIVDLTERVKEAVDNGKAS